MSALYKKHFFDLGYFIKRFGVVELFLIPVRKLLSPIIVRHLGKRTFVLDKKEFAYFYVNRFQTWSNERCIEVAACLPEVQKHNPQDILEVGNVFSQYFDVQHTVLDKYQGSEKIEVLNKDICDVQLDRKYSLIFSISTLEHVGFDEGCDESTTRQKIIAAFNNTLAHLADGGLFIVTLPIGYNPVLDGLIRDQKLPIHSPRFMKRIKYSTWQECSLDEAIDCRYGAPYPFANALYLGIFQK